ncbi:hypothetical protein GF312_01070 [Candidatus Poribacteria bacterium]|nr:hypothetical protein [Candidatus Poribacteria bacterium]
MKITKVDIVYNKKPIPLPEPWQAAWSAPDGKPVTSMGFSLYRMETDEGIVGYGPNTGANPNLAVGFDPHQVGYFWNKHMSGRRSGLSGKGAAGLEIAMWDIIGKAAKQPVSKLLGARTDKLLVYAATSRLLEKKHQVRQALELEDEGFKAIKLRLHRPDPWDDLDVVEAVVDEVDDDMMILVDANQNNPSDEYQFWSRQTALRIASELDDLGVYYLEEPLPRIDIEGLTDIADTVDMFVAGGEHSPTVYDFREHIIEGAYDIIQPDVAMTGNIGIIGIKKAADMADLYTRLVVPHVLSGGNCGIALPATLQAMATVDNCPLVEYPYDPPILEPKTNQSFVKEPVLIDEDGYVKVPELPGLGVEIEEDKITIK